MIPSSRSRLHNFFDFRNPGNYVSKQQMYYAILFLALCVVPTFAVAEAKGGAIQAKPGTTTQAKTVAVPASRFEEIGKGKSPKIGLSTNAGKTIDSFPNSLIGNWGGKLQVWLYEDTTLYRTLDLGEAELTKTYFKKGRSGSTNLTFSANNKGKVTLEPINILVNIPISETNHAIELPPDLPPDMVAKISDLKAPMMIHLGAFRTSKDEKGVTHNEMSSMVVKERIASLGNEVYEYQTFVRGATLNPVSKRTFHTIDETVVWLKPYEDGKYLYTRVASVKFDATARCLNRLIMTGSLAKGNKQDTKPRMPLQEFQLPPPLPTTGP